MTTPTTRYSLAKIVLASDNVDVVADFNNNWDAIDAKLGTQTCLSSARPASPIQGMLIYETDTGFVRKWTGSAWATVGNATSLSSARPANPITGDELYETNTGMSRFWTGSAWSGFLPTATSGSLPANPQSGDFVYCTDIGATAYYSGSAWHFSNIIAVASSSRPTGGALQIGSVIYETDTTRLLVYNGTTWVNKSFSNFVCTSGTHPASPFQGLEIFETDTGLSAVYTGSQYSYGLTQVAPTQVLGATTASVTFSSLPPVNNLVLKWRAKSNNAGFTDLGIRVDGSSTAANYIAAKITGRGAATTSSLAANTNTYGAAGIIAPTTPASYFSSGSLEISGWGTSTGFVTWAGTSAAFDSSSTYAVESYGGEYLVVGPHTSLTIVPSASASFVAGSMFALYAAQ